MNLIKASSKINISVITINLNNLNGLKKTIDSVLEQDTKNYEFIIIDGGSIDGSLEVIKKAKDSLAHWVSESDSGIYEAMNKGIKFATGKYCIFLNSGDFFYSNKILSSFNEENHDHDLVIGNSLIINKKFEEFIMKSPANINFRYLVQGITPIPHQASFIKKSILEKVGLYNVQNRIVSDWEFFLNATCLYNCNYLHLDKIISICEELNTSNNEELNRIEKNRVLNENFKNIWTRNSEIQNLYSTNVGHLYIYVCDNKIIFNIISNILNLFSFLKIKFRKLFNII